MATLQTIRQAGDVLELFTRQDPEWGVREVARRLAIPKSNAHQLLASLEAIGLLHRMVTGRYRLGFKILTLGQYLLTNTPWRDVAHRAMLHLEALTAQTVHLGALDGGRLIYVNKVLGSSPNAVDSPQTEIGNAVSPHASALGRVLLASKSWRVVQGTIEATGLRTQTPHTITELHEFKRELEHISQQGFALDLEESRLGVCCIAAPVRNHNGDVIAALGISLRSNREVAISTALRDQVKLCAEGISRSLAFNPEFVIENRTQSRLAGRIQRR